MGVYTLTESDGTHHDISPFRVGDTVNVVLAADYYPEVALSDEGEILRDKDGIDLREDNGLVSIFVPCSHPFVIGVPAKSLTKTN